MKEELTTAMHAEFTVSAETDLRQNAFSLLEMERDGIAIDDEWIQERGLTLAQFEKYRQMWNSKFEK